MSLLSLLSAPNSPSPPVVLLAFASSAAPGLRELKELEQEHKQLQALYEEAEYAGRCKLVHYAAVTLGDLLALFQADRYAGRIQVLHFAGHADGEALAMEDGSGQTLLAGAAGLAAFLATEPSLHLVFLNGCCTQAQVGGLHAAGVPAVIATAAEVDDKQARAFAVHFHRALSGGSSIAAAFAAAQAALQAATYASAQSWDSHLWLLSTTNESAAQWKLAPSQATAQLAGLAATPLEKPLAGPAAKPLANFPTDPRWRVPFLRNDFFVGREDDLRELHDAFAAGGTVGIGPAPAVAGAGLRGMGGIGKTQLAVEYCYRHWNDYPGGIFWINGAADWREEFAALGAYLAPDLVSDLPVRLARAAAEYLKTHLDCLLVIDNVRDPAELRRPVTPDLIPRGLPCRLLITTRNGNLADFGDVRAVAVTVLPEEPGLQLLLRAAARRDALSPDHPEHAAACAIYRMLGGLPLALDIAGAFLAEWPEVGLADFGRRLSGEGRLATLDAEGRELTAGSLRGVHAAAVATMLSEQWDALGTGKPVDDDARLLLQVAGCLPEAAQIPAARLCLLAGLEEESATGRPGRPSRSEQALRRLERASLVEVLHEGALRLHPLLHEFAQDKTPAEERPRLGQACARRLLAAYQQVANLEQQYTRRGIDAIEQDLLAALALLPGELGEQVAAHKAEAAALRASTLRRWRKRRSPANGSRTCDIACALHRLLRMVQHESHNLRSRQQIQQTPQQEQQQQAFFLQQWHKRALIDRVPDHAVMASARLGSLAIPYLVMQWTTAQENGGCLRTLSGHADWVYAVAITSDGQRAVSASGDGTLKVWELESGRELHTLGGHSGEVRDVAVTVDGQQAISAAADGLLKVWDLEEGCELRTLGSSTGKAPGETTAVAVTPDGRRAVSASGDGTLKVWDLEDGRELYSLSGHVNRVEAVALTADGQRAVSASYDHTLKVWDLVQWRELYTLSGHTSAVKAVAVAPDGLRVVSGSVDSTLKVWDLQRGCELYTLSGHTGGVFAVALTADGQRAVSASWDDTIKIWDLESRRELHSLSGPADWATAVAVTADGRQAVLASWDDTLKVWDLMCDSKRPMRAGHAYSVATVTVTSDGRRVVSMSSDGIRKVWELQNGRKLHTLGSRPDAASAVAATADGREVWASSDETLTVWDLESGLKLRTAVNAAGEVNDLVVTADGRRAVAVSWDDTLRVWDLESGRELHSLHSHAEEVSAIAVTPDGRRAIAGAQDGTLKVWDLESGRELHTLRGHANSVTAVVVTADGRQAVSAAGDCKLRVWDLESGRELHTLSGHSGGISAVAVTADGRRAVSAATDRTIKVWDLQRSVLQAGLTLDAQAFCLAIASDGVTIIAGDASGDVHCLRYCEAA